MTTWLPSNPDDGVYTGIWINRSFGLIHGATLTLERQSGGVLIAFLALYVGTTGTSFWKIVCFIMHHIYSSTAASDGIYHQRQAILRNSQSAQNAALTLIHTCIVWRKRAQRMYRRTLPVLLASLLVTGAFATAGILSSRVTTNTVNQVLIGKVCGNITKTTNDMPLMFDRASKLTNYLAYAQQCYRRRDLSHSTNCRTFIKPAITYTTDPNARCPFSDEMCISNSQNLFLDTGYLDSDSDLGVNEGPRFLVRSTRHCAPLVTHNYSRLYTDLQDPSIRFMRYYYGRSNLSHPSGNKDTFVYQVRVNQSQPFSSNTMFHSKMADYGISALYTSASERHLFSPLPQLDRPDARTSLLFLESSGVLYINRTEDPWFAATTAGTMNVAIQEAVSGLQEFHVANEPAGVLGCATQRFYCNPELPEDKRCVNILGPYDLGLLSKLWPNEADQAILRGTIAPIHIDAASHPEVFYLASSLPTLLTRFTLLGPWQTDTIPSNKWQQEMEYIFQGTLTSLQSSLVEDAMGDLLAGGDICTKTRERCIKKCYSQKIYSSRYYSFSILGVAIILCVGGIIMLLGLFLEDLAKLMNNVRSLRHSKITYATLEWQANSTLQLQRIAHETLGLGTWSKAAGSVPVTEKDEILGVLDITDRKHPRLGFVHDKATKDGQNENATLQRGYSDERSLFFPTEEDSPSTSTPSHNTVGSEQYREVPYYSDIDS